MPQFPVPGSWGRVAWGAILATGNRFQFPYRLSRTHKMYLKQICYSIRPGTCTHNNSWHNGKAWMDLHPPQGTTYYVREGCKFLIGPQKLGTPEGLCGRVKVLLGFQCYGSSIYHCGCTHNDPYIYVTAYYTSISLLPQDTFLLPARGVEFPSWTTKPG